MQQSKVVIFSFMAKTAGRLNIFRVTVALVYVLTASCFTAGNAYAQFTPLSPVPQFELLLDTVIDSKQKLNLKVYSDAYDDYLRRIQRQMRNTLILGAGSGINFGQNAVGNMGGSNFWNIGALINNMQHVYKAPIFSNTTTFFAAYTMTNTDKRLRKSDDRLRLTITPQWSLSPTSRWSFTSSLDLYTQFTKSYQQPQDSILISAFMAPGTLSASVGITYTSPKGLFIFYISPVGGNLVTYQNNQLAHNPSRGIDAGRTYKANFASRMEITVNSVKLWKDKFTIYSKMISSWDYNYTPNFDWNTNLNLKLTTLLSLNFMFHVIYNEKAITPKLQQERTSQNWSQTANPGGGIPSVNTQPVRYSKFEKFLQIHQSSSFSITYSFTSKKPAAPLENNLVQARPKKGKKNKK